MLLPFCGIFWKDLETDDWGRAMRDLGWDTAELRRLLLGTDDRWDDGELATVLISGLRLAVIEGTIGLRQLPWPETELGQSAAVRAQNGLSSLINGGNDPNLSALKLLTDTRKPTTTRLTEVAEMFGRTSSRTGRNRLKHEILPWFFDYLVDHLESASDRLRAAPPADATRPSISAATPLTAPGTYRPELRAPIDPAALAQCLKERYLQVALDLSDLEQATRLAQVAAANGADLIEVGDPLIKRFGMEAAVGRIRHAVPGVPLVVEFSSSDWVDEQIDLAATTGADLVYVLGLDQPSRIERAVRAARNRRVGIVPAIPSHVDIDTWCSAVEAAGCDAISVIRNIDSAESVAATTQRMQQVAAATSTPLVISGGFAPGNIAEVLTDEWSVLIVGGAVVNAREPGSVVRSLRQTLDTSA